MHDVAGDVERVAEVLLLDIAVDFHLAHIVKKREIEFAGATFLVVAHKRDEIIVVVAAKRESAVVLDDVFSELDSARRDYILSRTADRQVIITCCDCDILGSFMGYKGIYVENGKYR